MPETAAKPAALADELGYMLSRTRQERGLTIDRIAKAIHMRKHYIQALESGKFEDLPGAIYVRGYLKRYAEFLELNEATVLSLYDQMERPEPRKFFTLPVSLERNPYPSPRLAFSCLAISIGLFLFWGASQKMPAVQLIEPYAPFKTITSGSTLPHRCEGVKTTYPPCYWEDLNLWYELYPTKHFDLYLTKQQ